MSKHCCNNNCCNSGGGFNNNIVGGNNPFIYILAIFLVFGGVGFGEGSFWSGYNNIFRCSGFNNGWCTDNNSGFNGSLFNNGNYNTNNPLGSNISNSNFSNSNLAGLLNGFSDNNNSIIGNLLDE